MADDLQGLLQKINEEGLQKAESEKEKIIAQAKDAAAKITADAEAEAAAMRKQAELDVAASEKRAKAAISQAARDILIALKSELAERLQNLIKSCVGKAMDAAAMKEIILEVVAKVNEGDSLELILPKKRLDELESKLLAGLKDDLKKTPQIFSSTAFGGGLKIAFKDNDVLLDFSDDALAELLGAYLGPHFSEYLATDKGK